MGYYNYLCELLRPLRVYRLDEGSLSGAELYAAGEGLDAAAEALEKAPECVFLILHLLLFHGHTLRCPCVFHQLAD